MKTPTLVLAVILAMAVVGDSANMEKILRQLRLLADEETIDDAPMTHADEENTQSDGSPTNSKETKLLDHLKKLTASKSEQKEIPEEEHASDVEQNYDVPESGSQDSSFEDEETIDDAPMTHSDEETAQSDGSPINSKETKLLDLLKRLNTALSEQEAAEEDKEAASVEQNYDVAGIGDHDSPFECDVPGASRRDCGWVGMSEADCRQQGCCWNPNSNGHSWCFFEIECDVPGASRRDCGWIGMSEEDCRKQDCCWNPNSNGHSWCFFKKG